MHHTIKQTLAAGAYCNRHDGNQHDKPLRCICPRIEPRGEELLVEYLGEQYPVTVETNDATGVFDPENTKVRA